MSNNQRRPSVLVTGATGGIGAATVRALVDKGYRVYASARGESQIFAGLPEVCWVTMDVTDPDSVAAAAAVTAFLMSARRGAEPVVRLATDATIRRRNGAAPVAPHRAGPRPVPPRRILTEVQLTECGARSCG